MEEAVCINDYGQGCASDGNGDSQMNHLNNMDLNLLDKFDSSFLELDEEDLSEIHRMVDEWELNFGALESSDGEELVRLIQIDDPSQLGWSYHPDIVESNHNSNNADWSSNAGELHDRLPSYYTALASSRSAPWMPPASQLVFNKLPAYITDMAPLDAAATSDTACGSVGQPGKKKLNLAEYRTRREKQLQQIQEEEEQQQQQQQLQIKQEEQDQQVKQQEAKEQKDEIIKVKVEKVDKKPCQSKQSKTKESALVKDEPEEGEVEEEEVKEKQKKKQEVTTSVKSRRIRSSRSPTRSYSSQSSSSRRCRSSSASSYSSRSRSRSPSHRRGRRRRRSSSNSSSSSSSWHRKMRHNSSRRRTGRRRRTPTPPPRLSSRGGYGDRSHQRRHQQQSERQRQIEERRVIYVGKLADGTTRSDLRQRFEPFGPVVDISLHFRERGDNYGFVTFAYKVDAYEAVEHGNDDPHLPKYDLSFGGRRAFCKETYADLDAVDDDGRSKANDVDFETLLRAVQVQLTRRPCS
uniref:RRM domain-containing protein n=2 Tax=Daphnia TaxID=6668 RepID=A0A8J2W677_9CRUS|nr:unnamed protein product [Daphnia galeata]